MKNPKRDIEVLQTFVEICGEPVDEDTAEIVDPTPLQSFVDEGDSTSDGEEDSREIGGNDATR